jgi:hypothetical protein
MFTAEQFRVAFFRLKSRIYITLGALALLAAMVRWGGASPVSALLACLAAMLIFIVVVPRYLRFILSLEERVHLKLGYVTPGRLLRTFMYAPLFIWVFLLPPFGGSRDLQGEVLLFLAMLGASNGLHSAAATLAFRGYGDRIGNVTLAASLSAWLAYFGYSYPASLPLLLGTTALFGAEFLVGILSDMRSVFYPRGGVGVLFGSFNPVHRTHVRLIKAAIERRNIRRVYVHATTVPKLHRQALSNGELRITRLSGMRKYETTEAADPNKNYFPTGDRFYEYRVRRELLVAAVRDEGLDGRVEVLDLPDLYEKSGFFGILRHIKALHKGEPIHGLHGTDAGGMWIRSVFDQSGWIYPCPFVRSDNVSATAIRNGAVGLTPTTVESFLRASRTGQDFTFPSGFVFHAAPPTVKRVENAARSVS